MKKVFLGGTKESTWRNQIIIYLSEAKVNYFNPIVDNWNVAAQTNELRERKKCDFCLYTLTPKMTGVYAVAEVVDDSNKRPDKTILILLRNDGGKRFTESQWKSLLLIAQIVIRNGGKTFYNLKCAAVYIAAL